MTIIGIVGIDVYTSDGQKFDARDFINSPRVGDRILQHDDRLLSEHQGDENLCSSGVCPVK